MAGIDKEQWEKEYQDKDTEGDAAQRIAVL